MWSKLNDRMHAWLSVAIILFSAIALLVRYPVAFVLKKSQLPGDFMVYFNGWARVASGVNPYNPNDPSPYKYAPGALAMFGILPHDPNVAWVVFSSVSILAFAAALWFGAKYRGWRDVWLLFFGLVLAWKGILETLDYGQLELLILAISVFAALALRRFPFMAGLLAGVLPWLKLPWLLLGLGFFAFSLGATGKRSRNFFSGYLTSCFFWGAALPSILFGPERALELSQSWIDLLRLQPSALYSSDINQSLWMTLYRWFSGNELVVAVIGGILALALVAVMVVRTYGRARRGRGQFIEPLRWVGPWLIVTQLLNPLSWRWGSVFVVAIPLATVDSRIWHRVVRKVLWGMVVVGWLLQLNPVVQFLGFDHWTYLHGSGLITFFWATLLLLSL